MREEKIDYGSESLNAPKMVEVDGARLNIIDEGRSINSGPLLLVQGLGCEAEVIWRPLLKELLALGDDRQHIAFDVRGIGMSSGWPESLEQVADDAAAILNQRAAYPAEVVGHSLGGVVAILLASRHPALVRNLVLIDSVPVYNEKASSGFLWRAEKIREAGTISTIFDIVIPRSFSATTQTERPEVIAQFQDMLNRQDPEVYSHICELAAAANTLEAFKSIQVPMLFLAGSEDLSISPHLTQSLAMQSGGHFAEVQGAGHNPPLEQPARVAKAILEYSQSF